MLDERGKIDPMMANGSAPTSGNTSWDIGGNSSKPHHHHPSLVADPTLDNMFAINETNTAVTLPPTPSLVEQVPPPPPPMQPALRTGRWTHDEKLLFLFGLKRFGKGRWKKMSVYLPHRSLVQIKSHAQKVVKRQEAGENIFQKLDETNSQFMDSLIHQASREREALRAAGVNVNTTKPSKTLVEAAKKTRKATSYPKKNFSAPSMVVSNNNNIHYHTNPVNTDAGSIGGGQPANNGNPGGPESVIAAAALCQLSSVGTQHQQQQQQQQQWDQLDPLNVMPMVDQHANV